MKQSEIKKLTRRLFEYHDTRIEMMLDQKANGVDVPDVDIAWEKGARNALWQLYVKI